MPPTIAEQATAEQQQSDLPASSADMSSNSLGRSNTVNSTRSSKAGLITSTMTSNNNNNSSSPDTAYSPIAHKSSSSQDSGPPTSPTPNTSIEHSVRLFKIFEALRHGDTTAISKAVRETETSRLQGTTVLHLAVQCAEPTVVEFVLSLAQPGSDINANDKEGNTALHIASQLGRTTVVKLLLDQKGINESLANYQGKTALDLARNPEVYSHLQLARSIFIDEATRRIQDLVRSSSYTDLEEMLADDHVRSVVDVNNPDLATEPLTVESGGTLLHEATRKRDTKLIQILLFNGADPFTRDRKGKLPQDITKDDRIKQILKNSPAAAVAQRGVQEKAILGANNERAAGHATAESALGAREAREMKGYLKKWTNYTTGWKLRWFVLEDGVLSYYKHQDDAGSACRGAINMRIATLHMDPKEKVTFEIHGKSSVKYHLKANHEVESKRWFWALNNAIQWAKDEARSEAQRAAAASDKLREARGSRQSLDGPTGRTSMSGATSTSTPISTLDAAKGSTSAIADPVYESSPLGDDTSAQIARTGTMNDSDPDDDYGDDDSTAPTAHANSKDAFNITAQSAKLQLDLLADISSSLARERSRNPSATLSASDVENVLLSYDSAANNLRGLLLDLLKIHKDHDAYWQYRLDRETNMRRLWEESMTKVAREQEQLEAKIGQSEDKRKRTKRALREALEGGNASGFASQARSRRGTQTATNNGGALLPAPKLAAAVGAIEVGRDGRAVPDQAESGVVSPLPIQPLSRRMTLGQLTNDDMSDDESDMDEEFFDAVDAGEVEVLDDVPGVASPPATPGVPAGGIDDAAAAAGEKASDQGQLAVQDDKSKAIEKSYKGYEDGLRERLALNADNRPKVSLWVSQTWTLIQQWQ